MKPARQVAASPAPPDQPSPLRPQRRLFWILTTIVALWIIALLLMYLLTVRPNRNHPPAESVSLRFERVG